MRKIELSQFVRLVTFLAIGLVVCFQNGYAQESESPKQEKVSDTASDNDEIDIANDPEVKQKLVKKKDPEKKEKSAGSIEEESFDEDDCSALFGSESIEDANEAKRKKQLGRVMESNGIITIIHHTKLWTNATHARATGIDLDSIEKAEDGEYHAFFEIGPEIAEMYGCQDGIYEVSQDASIFSMADVLWISPNMVLLEYKDKLVYMTPDRSTRYIIRFVWQSPWSIIRTPEPRNSRSRSRRHNRRKNRRRRRR